jgi:hypothetical protein
MPLERNSIRAHRIGTPSDVSGVIFFNNQYPIPRITPYAVPKTKKAGTAA